MTSRIYLASKSPRRREILAGLGYEDLPSRAGSLSGICPSD